MLDVPAYLSLQVAEKQLLFACKMISPSRSAHPLRQKKRHIDTAD
jgi:hypothetical protein